MALGVAMTRQKVKFTYEDYKSLPASETKRYELLGGELVLVPSPSEYHQRILRNLAFLLWRFVKERSLGWVYFAPLDVVLGEGEDREVVQPDIIFISRERTGIIAEEEIRGAPDLEVEITSPGTAERDRHYKNTPATGWRSAGLWTARPRRWRFTSLGKEDSG